MQVVTDLACELLIKVNITVTRLLLWLRVSLRCCTYVGGGGGAMIFSFDK